MALVAAYGSESSGDESDVPMTLAEENDPFSDEDGNSKLSSLLPKPQRVNKGGFIDESEDLSSIPKAKVYEEPEKPPSKTKVKIGVPSLKSLRKLEEEDDEAKPIPTGGIPKSSGKSIASLLPPPKHFLPNKTPPPVSLPKASTSKTKPSQFIPRSIRKSLEPRPPKKARIDSSSDEDEGESSNFFSFEDSRTPSSPSKIPLTLPVMANPLVDREDPMCGPEKPPTPLPTVEAPVDDRDLMADEAALERLAGKHALRKKEHLHNVVEVNGEDNRPDPKVWLTKAITEDELSKPGPRVTIKGVQKTRHQITYLAQLAKANEHKLKQEWANNAHNRRQSAQKYGF